MNRGFSLVELSIVLVILGLLTGGILAGQSLIRAAELRAVTTEYNRWVTATQTFRDKYFAIPGDFNGATKFWGRQRNTADCVTNSSAAVNAAGTCDGDGDGLIELPTAAYNPDVSGETFQFWRHLQLAGLVEGSITGYSSPSGVAFTTADTHPKSKLSNAYWSALSDMTWYGAANYPRAVGANTFFLGNYALGTLEGVLDQEEMWNIDTKMDDGIPTTGNVVTRRQGWGGATACITGAAGTPGVYQLNVKSKYCTFVGLNAI